LYRFGLDVFVPPDSDGLSRIRADETE